jgi:hypothetical protein
MGFINQLITGGPHLVPNVNPGWINIINPKRLFFFGGYHFSAATYHYLGEPPQVINQPGFINLGLTLIFFRLPNMSNPWFLARIDISPDQERSSTSQNLDRENAKLCILPTNLWMMQPNQDLGCVVPQRETGTRFTTNPAPEFSIGTTGTSYSFSFLGRF